MKRNEKMRDKKEKQKWCPHGRISIQNWEGGKFREAVPGSHNLVVVVDRLNGTVGKEIQPASPCQRELCALYKKGVQGHGRCGLESSPTGPWIFAALITMEIIAISATWLLKHLG